MTDLACDGIVKGSELRRLTHLQILELDLPLHHHAFKAGMDALLTRQLAVIVGGSMEGNVGIGGRSAATPSIAPPATHCPMRDSSLSVKRRPLAKSP